MKPLLLFAALLFSSITMGQGYNFLGSYTSDGTPLYLVQSDVIDSATLNLVHNSLPENYPVPTYNPQYISSGYDTNLIIDSTADVWVTFVSEGAGYKNVLGFYTYDINNPPTVAPTASQITIVFPNVSAAGSGGGLLAGNKVKIGTFSAGTGIGWVLLANAWNGTQVTNGLWRLFSDTSFNPEANPSLRQHNVLLNDPNNERIILGFEDIRRDNSSCDNDFNDAVFYVSANPYSALRIQNLADVSSATNVSSGNDGGLESNGDLATLIAKRNFSRIKTNSFADKKATQKKFSASSNTGKKSEFDYSYLIPNTGMFGTETAYVSSPTDLIGITNAKQVYSVDYYQGENRVAAVLATTTMGGVYDHSKVICDRLNGSSLEDIRTINLNGFEIIMVKLTRADGKIEYALSFSVQQLANENKFNSYWNISQYPASNYLNFQVWGASMGQVCSIVNNIITKLQEQGTLSSNLEVAKIPAVFVKKGSYKNGKLNLTIINKTKSSNLAFNGNKKSTELSNLEFVSQNVTLSLEREQNITLNLGNLFDVGFSILGDNSIEEDNLYMADGPWGVDYLSTESDVTSFEIQTNLSANLPDEQYRIERNAKVTGTVYGTLNLFRNILSGEQKLDAKNYSNVAFAIQNSLPIEVVMVTENMTDWNDRLRYQINSNENLSQVSIPLVSFTNPKGAAYQNEKIKGFVFSVKGNYSKFQPFELNVIDLSLSNQNALNTNINNALVVTKAYNTPNPFSKSTTILLPEKSKNVTVKLIDISGRIVQDKIYEVTPFNTIDFTSEATSGLYFISIKTEENKEYLIKCLIK